MQSVELILNISQQAKLEVLRISKKGQNEYINILNLNIVFSVYYITHIPYIVPSKVAHVLEL